MKHRNKCKAVKHKAKINVCLYMCTAQRGENTTEINK